MTEDQNRQNAEPAWTDVAEHVIQMQNKYDFRCDVDSVREAVEESANLLGIALNEVEIIEACHRIEERNSTGAGESAYPYPIHQSMKAR